MLAPFHPHNLKSLNGGVEQSIGINQRCRKISKSLRRSNLPL
ncbi:hypothetical protein [Vibrio owensii]